MQCSFAMASCFSFVYRSSSIVISYKTSVMLRECYEKKHIQTSISEGTKNNNTRLENVAITAVLPCAASRSNALELDHNLSHSLAHSLARPLARTRSLSLELCRSRSPGTAKLVIQFSLAFFMLFFNESICYVAAKVYGDVTTKLNLKNAPKWLNSASSSNFYT